MTNLMPKTIIKADFEPDGSVMFPPTAPVDEKFRMPERIEEDPKALQVALAKEKKQKAKSSTTAEAAASHSEGDYTAAKACETEKKSNRPGFPAVSREELNVIWRYSNKTSK